MELKGFEVTGEYRAPKKGEWFWSDASQYEIKAAANYYDDEKRTILRKVRKPKAKKPTALDKIVAYCENQIATLESGHATLAEVGRVNLSGEILKIIREAQ